MRSWHKVRELNTGWVGWSEQRGPYARHLLLELSRCEAGVRREFGSPYFPSSSSYRIL